MAMARLASFRKTVANLDDEMKDAQPPPRTEINPTRKGDSLKQQQQAQHHAVLALVLSKVQTLQKECRYRKYK
eukprot:8968065-Ditylum_brightwellii.AAC.1